VSGGPTPASLPTLLQQEAAQVRGFLDLLQREQQALVAGEVEGLMALAAQKSETIARLASLAEARNRALAAESLAADRAGVEVWLERNPAQAGARRSWQELLAITVQARNLNELNGKLIAARLASNQQALAALFSAASQAALYGPDGQARPVGSGRSLGSV
jgi:flagella synthesis protein FlgN